MRRDDILARALKSANGRTGATAPTPLRSLTTTDDEPDRPRSASSAPRLRSVPPASEPPPARAAEETTAPAPGRWTSVRLIALLLLPVVLAAAGAYLVASRIEKTYAARSEILFHLARGGDVAERFLATQSVVAQSRAVLTPVARKLLVPVEALEERLKVEFPKGSSVMRLQYADPDGAAALDVVRAVTDQYLTALRQIEVAEGGGHQLFVPPYLLDEPVWPQPLQAAAVGAAVGLAIAAAALVLVQQSRAAR